MTASRVRRLVAGIRSAVLHTLWWTAEVNDSAITPAPGDPPTDHTPSTADEPGRRLPDPVAHLVVTLDVPMIVAEAALDTSIGIDCDGNAGTLHWPTIATGEEDDPLHRPVLAPAEFERAAVTWAHLTSSSDAGLQVAIETLAFTFTIRRGGVAIAAADLPNAYAKGMEPLRAAVEKWVSRLCALAPLVVRQPLDPADPSPMTIDRSSARALTWLEMDGHRSWVNSEQGTIVVVSPGATPWAEKVADADAVSRMMALASTAAPVPTPVALLSAARVAAHRGKRRLALMELGTCLEAVLTARLGLQASHRYTLGPLTQEARRQGVPLAADVQTVFVNPRNQAVHGGIDPTNATLVQAFEIIVPLVDADHPAYACDDTVPNAHRPQRLNLHIVQPPKTRNACERGHDGE